MKQKSLATTKRALYQYFKDCNELHYNGRHYSLLSNKELALHYNAISGKNIPFVKDKFIEHFYIGDIVKFKKKNRTKTNNYSAPDRINEYHQYIKSVKWKSKRELLFNERGKMCQKCGSHNDIQVHHLTYKNIFNEPLGDLMVVCRKCHKKIHKIK